MSDRLALGVLLAGGLAGCAGPQIPDRPLQLDATEVWLAPMRTYAEGQVWFADELQPVEDAVAARLEQAGLRVVDPAMLRRLRAEVRRGALPGRPARCATPPAPARVTQAYLRGASAAELELLCDDGRCELVLQVFDPRPDGGRGPVRRRFEASVPGRSSPRVWVHLVRTGAMREVPLPEPLGIGGLGIAGGERRTGLVVSLRYPRHAGPWTEKLDSAVLEPHKEALHACRTAGGRWMDTATPTYVIAVDRDGRITRCEDDAPDRVPSPTFSCRCEVLRTQVRLPRGGPGRRARFGIGTVVIEDRPRGPPDPMYRSLFVTEKRSADPTAALGASPIDFRDVQACLKPHTERLGEFEIATRFEVTEDGRVRRHNADWPAGVPTTLRACLEGVLAKSRFTCPTRAPASVDATLKLTVISYAELRQRQR